jgi:aryl-alcohol dehydrogenase
MPLPIVLGHEGASVVERVGAGVTRLEPGDHVVLSFPSCVAGPAGLGTTPIAKADTRFASGSRPDGSSPLHRPDGAAPSGDVHGSLIAQSSFATHALATASNIVKVPRDAPLELLGPLGCGFQTGAGAVFNSLQVRAGENIAILGVGEAGLAAVIAARIAGANHIIAVDINAQRLALANELGATHTINAKTEDVVARTAEITGAASTIRSRSPDSQRCCVWRSTYWRPWGSLPLIGGAPAGAE